MFFFGISSSLVSWYNVHKKLNLQGIATLRLNVKIFNDKTALDNLLRYFILCKYNILAVMNNYLA